MHGIWMRLDWDLVGYQKKIRYIAQQTIRVNLWLTWMDAFMDDADRGIRQIYGWNGWDIYTEWIGKWPRWIRVYIGCVHEIAT